MRRSRSLRVRFASWGALAALAVAPVLAHAQPAAQGPEWVQKSNAHAQVVLDVLARLGPEGAGQMGVPGLDEEIFDLKPGFVERQREMIAAARAELEKRLAAETVPPVRQDLQIMIDALDDDREGFELQYKLEVPFFSVSSVVFQGLKGLLDDQVPAERRQAALVRLRKYAGVEKGYEPIASLAEAAIRERLDVPGLIGPPKGEVDRQLSNSATYVDGIGKLFAKYKIKGYEKPLAALRKQVEGYDAFVRAEVLPRARTDFRQPPELYAHALKSFGNDMPVDELTRRAEVAFKEIQAQMQALAPLVAKQEGIDATDYRDVLRALKQKQLVGDAILPHYQARIGDLEKIIRDHAICTVPARDMQVRLASEAESAAIPAPTMRPPRLIGNTGEMGTFILPLRIPDTDGQVKGFDDFTFEAASWTLTAHEGRPGHELQFASMIERGVSLARAFFAFNSVNAEGWALYAEAEVQPYLPLDGQLITLQHRLMRAARAFLDPGLQAGTITPEQATRILREDVVLSEPMAQQEVQRYTIRSPGQAPSYFVGYCRLLETRAEAERTLGARFDRMKFNDFVLAQGTVPPVLLRKAVEEQFVPAQMAAR